LCVFLLATSSGVISEFFFDLKGSFFHLLLVSLFTSVEISFDIDINHSNSHRYRYQFDIYESYYVNEKSFSIAALIKAVISRTSAAVMLLVPGASCNPLVYS
jgi:hypothetical protein